MESIVTISQGEFENLILKADAYDKLVDAIFDGAGLSYNNEYLIFDDHCIREFIKIHERHRYMRTLREEKENE